MHLSLCLQGSAASVRWNPVTTSIQQRNGAESIVRPTEDGAIPEPERQNSTEESGGNSGSHSGKVSGARSHRPGHNHEERISASGSKQEGPTDTRDNNTGYESPFVGRSDKVTEL